MLNVKYKICEHQFFKVIVCLDEGTEPRTRLRGNAPLYQSTGFRSSEIKLSNSKHSRSKTTQETFEKYK